jgi:shikimate kinase
MKNIILCGLPGAGKTEVGKQLSDALSWKFINTDNCIEQHHHDTQGTFLTCREIYQTYGGKAFYQLEHEALQTISRTYKNVFSLGGGTLERNENITLLKSLGIFIYLKNDPNILFERLIKKGIPAYLDPQNPYISYLKLAEHREIIFETHADLKIDTHLKSPQDIVQQIKAHLK